MRSTERRRISRYLLSDQRSGYDFTNLKDNHELYCFGHLTEGAVAYYQATGKDRLLKAAERFADFIASKLGHGEGKKQVIRVTKLQRWL